MTEATPDNITKFFENLEARPREMRMFFDLNPEKSELLIPLLDLALKPAEEKFRYLEDLYARSLSPRPNTTALFLASGLGYELIAARKVMPNSRLIAVETDVTGDAVMTQVATGAEFLDLDLETWEPSEITEVIDNIPDYVVCRHPNVGRDSWFPRRIADWASHIQQKPNTRMLVTNFSLDERQQIAEALAPTGIKSQTFEFPNGAVINNPFYGVHRQDRFVTVIGSPDPIG